MIRALKNEIPKMADRKTKRKLGRTNEKRKNNEKIRNFQKPCILKSFTDFKAKRKIEEFL